MSILHQFTVGQNIKVRKGEKPVAALKIIQNPRLGFLVSIKATSDRRQLFLMASECPLTIGLQVKLWINLYKWKIGYRKGSLKVSELLEAQQVTPMKNQIDAILTSILVLKSFMPPEFQSEGLPDLVKLVNARRTEQGLEPIPYLIDPNLEQNLPEEDFEVEDEEIDIDAELAEVDALIDSEESEESEELEVVEVKKEITAPEKFKNKKGAVKWALELKAFETAEEAIETYDEIKSDGKIKTMTGMTPIWVETIKSIMGA